jgi:anthrone oxygenase-like protein
MVIEIAGPVAVLAAALFAGAAVYVSLVEHPARMECGTELAATEFGPSYRRGAVMQAPLAILATVAGLACFAAGGGPLWLWGGLAAFAAVPFTLVVILPTNKLLLEPARDRGSAETRALLVRWGRLHAVRTLLGLASAALLVAALARQ